ncbi:MAG: ATP-binding protein [Bacteroidota bacterium]|nr:ATP-binding protein [Bacteroidota bacterium]
MKILVCIFLLATSVFSNAQTHTLEKMWETDTIVAIPESVLPDTKKKILYVSLIDGGPWDADGKGGVGKLNSNGKQYNPGWITGLNAPKGIGMAGNRLFVADMGNVVVIDIRKGKIEKKIPINTAQWLNDVTVSNKGIVYVSDSKTGRIWRMENDIAALYIDTLKGLNGLKAVGDELYIGAGKSFLKADVKKNITKVAELSQGIDGIEPVGNGDFILTSWGGYIFYISANGNVETLLDTHSML